MTGLGQPIFWTPQTNPATIILQPQPVPSDGFHIPADIIRDHVLHERDTTLLRLDLQGEHFDVTLSGVVADDAVAAVIPLDGMTPDRLTAINRFWAAAMRRPVPSDPRITPQRLQRARQMLRAVDARQTGAIYRSIAEQLYPAHKHDAKTWVESSIREATIRLVRDGMKLVRGGYRTLLRRPRRNR